MNKNINEIDIETYEGRQIKYLPSENKFISDDLESSSLIGLRNLIRNEINESIKGINVIYKKYWCDGFSKGVLTSISNNSFWIKGEKEGRIKIYQDCFLDTEENIKIIKRCDELQKEIKEIDAKRIKLWKTLKKPVISEKMSKHECETTK